MFMVPLFLQASCPSNCSTKVDKEHEDLFGKHFPIVTQAVQLAVTPFVNKALELQKEKDQLLLAGRKLEEEKHELMQKYVALQQGYAELEKKYTALRTDNDNDDEDEKNLFGPLDRAFSQECLPHVVSDQSLNQLFLPCNLQPLIKTQRGKSLRLIANEYVYDSSVSSVPMIPVLSAFTPIVPVSGLKRSRDEAHQE